MVPVAVQGASIRTNGAVSSTSRASASTISASSFVRARFSRMRSRARPHRVSTATSLQRTHRRQLHGLATWRRAQVDHPLAAYVTQQGSRATTRPHPAPTNGPAAKPGHAHRPGLLQRSAAAPRPNSAACFAGCVAPCRLQHNINRRFALGAPAQFARAVPASYCAGPACPQPIRRVDRRSLSSPDSTASRPGSPPCGARH